MGIFSNRLYWAKSLISFIVVLFSMPLGHALMMIMDKHLPENILHYCAFAMGFIGLVMVIIGVFVKKETAQTLWGFFGGLLFWTGWVEFLFVYYASRFGVHYDLIGSGIVSTSTEYLNGVDISHITTINGTDIKDLSSSALKSLRGSRPEYLIMPSSFGFWVMFMIIYLFNSRTGCHMYNWLQKKIFRDKRNEIVPRSMTRHTSITTFLELTIMMWTSYLVLMFCYDPVFLGPKHPITIAIAFFCLISSFFMFKYELKLGSWGANIRMAIATVMIFWTSVEIAGRNALFKEIWIQPHNYKTEMLSILVCFIILSAYLVYKGAKNNKRQVQK